MGEIREIVDDDVAAIHAINAANVPEVGPAAVDHLEFLIAEAAIALAVAVDGRPVGFCLVLPPGSPYDSVNYRWFMDRYDDAMYLDRVALDADHQGRGLGTALYSHVERAIIESHPWARRLTLEVNVEPRNDPSLAFHARHGFAEVGQQATSKGIRVSLMEKVLR
jgi:predicted GNAT superfamily acetyltransferase